MLTPEPALEPSDWIALLCWLTMLGVPVAVASALWAKQRRRAAATVVVVGWALVFAFATFLVWHGHTLREHQQRMQATPAHQGLP